ncbi:MAG: SLC13 family permease [Sphingomonadaceae bacterium]
MSRTSEAPDTHRSSLITAYWRIALAATVFLALLLMPPQPGLSTQGQRVLAIVATAVILWATEALPVAVSSLAVVVLLNITGGVRSPSEAAAGFSSPILYFLIGSQVMGAAVMQSGLAERLATYLVNRSQGSPRKLTLQLLLALPFMAFLIPSAINRNTMLIPAYEQVFRSLKVGKGDRLPRVIMLILGILNPLASSAFMTGGLASMTTSTLLGGFTWFGWFALMAVPNYLTMALGGAMIYLLYRPDGGEPQGHWDAEMHPASRVPRPGSGVPTQYPAPSARHSPLNRAERYTLLVIAATSLLWLTDFIHHWNAAIPALLAGTALMWPGVGVFTWKQFEKMVSWSNFFFLGASLSLTQALISTGAANWFAQGTLAILGNGMPSAVELALFVIAVTSVVHLAIPNQSACIALLIPVVTALAHSTQVNPMATGLIVGFVVDTVILYQVQTVTVLIAYETGHFSTRDVFRVGLGMLALTVGIVLLVAIPWWGLLGLALAP